MYSAKRLAYSFPALKKKQSTPSVHYTKLIASLQVKLFLFYKEGKKLNICTNGENLGEYSLLSRYLDFKRRMTLTSCVFLPYIFQQTPHMKLKKLYTHISGLTECPSGFDSSETERVVGLFIPFDCDGVLDLDQIKCSAFRFLWGEDEIDSYYLDMRQLLPDVNLSTLEKLELAAKFIPNWCQVRY
jgi:hypothetical protein